MERIINIEDSVIKHCEINRALQYNGYSKAIRAKTAEERLLITNGIENVRFASRTPAVEAILFLDSIKNFNIN